MGIPIWVTPHLYIESVPWVLWLLVCDSSGAQLHEALGNKMNPGYFSLEVIALKPQQILMFLHISTTVCGCWWFPHTWEEKGSENCNNSSIESLCSPDCTYMESMFINFIHINLYDIYLMQNILYHIKREVAPWKRLIPRHMQWTWWQIVATPYTGFRVFLASE